MILEIDPYTGLGGRLIQGSLIGIKLRFYQPWCPAEVQSRKEPKIFPRNIIFDPSGWSSNFLRIQVANSVGHSFFESRLRLI